MDIQDVRYNEFGEIKATINGSWWVIPDEPGNLMREVIAQWEAKGNVITPYDKNVEM